MTQLAELSPGDRVLEIGTGSGYQAAVLAEIVDRVWSVELLPDLAEAARERLSRLGYRNVRIRTGDGYEGWEEHAPFDAIVVTAAPERVPLALVEQPRAAAETARYEGARAFDGYRALWAAIEPRVVEP